ncbi:MAG: CBS domain-containing protein [Bacteroidota bacterium]
MGTDFKAKLEQARDTRQGFKSRPAEAMAYLQVKRRGAWVNQRLHNLLGEYGLISDPDIAYAHKWTEIEIKPRPTLDASADDGERDDDPTPRVGMLDAANIESPDVERAGLISVKRDTPLSDAITLMIFHDFSQIPVMSGKAKVDGIISWRSIGKKLGLGQKAKLVKDCMEEATIVKYNAPLFQVYNTILEKEFVLVRLPNQTISGIVTYADVSKKFIEQTEPFLVLEQIENHIRLILDGKLELDDLKKALDFSRIEKEIETLSDLSFGHYVRIIENKDCFEKLGLQVSRTILREQLEKANKIRNEVMHFNFNPDADENSEGESRSQEVQFLRQVNDLLHQLYKSTR